MIHLAGRKYYYYVRKRDLNPKSNDHPYFRSTMGARAELEQ